MLTTLGYSVCIHWFPGNDCINVQTAITLVYYWSVKYYCKKIRLSFVFNLVPTKQKITF